VSWRLFQEDCVKVMSQMDASSVEAVVTDPPYGLGFMGKAWDDLPPGREFAGEALRVLKPGGHLLAFGGTRTSHRLAVALEDEGFEIRDTIMWLYAQGFPKSKDAGDGWGTALKPAHEPIIVARRPLEGTVTENMRRYGTGALNIDATKIPFADGADLAEALAKNPGRDGEKVTSAVYGADRPQQVVDEAGRWPANLVLDEGAGQMLDSQSGERPGGGYPEQRGANGVYNPTSGGSDGPRSMGDTGGASRFFFCPKVGRLERDLGLTEFEAKALLWSSGEQSPGTFQSEGTDRSARNAHPTVKPIELMRWLCRLVTPPGGIVLDPFAGSGSTGIAAVLESFDFIGIEKEAEYAQIAEARIGRWEPYVGMETEGAMRSAAREELAKQAGQIGLLD
jgi:site-specific DNA-methyltransferase (adenine-specific)